MRALFGTISKFSYLLNVIILIFLESAKLKNEFLDNYKFKKMRRR